jgi:hypothetical protein
MPGPILEDRAAGVGIGGSDFAKRASASAIERMNDAVAFPRWLLA